MPPMVAQLLSTLVEFSDYECPHCAHAIPIIRQVEHDFPGRLLRMGERRHGKCQQEGNRLELESAVARNP